MSFIKNKLNIIVDIVFDFANWFEVFGGKNFSGQLGLKIENFE